MCSTTTSGTTPPTPTPTRPLWNICATPAFLAKNSPFLGDTRRFRKQVGLAGGDRCFVLTENSFAFVVAVTLGLQGRPFALELGLACGQPNIGIGWQSILAWQLGTNTGVLYYNAKYEKLHPHPIVNMYPHSYGWQFFPSNWTNAAQAARCRGLTLRT